MPSDPDRQKPEKGTVLLRLRRLLQRAATEGDEAVVIQALRQERLQSIATEEARAVRFEAYAALARWHDGTAADDTTGDGEAPTPLEAIDLDGEATLSLTRAAQRQEAKERARQFRREGRQQRKEAVADGSNFIAKATADAIDELARLQDLHETEREVGLLASFWASQADPASIPIPLAHKILLHCERLIDTGVPTSIYDHLRDAGGSSASVAGLLARHDARAANAPLRDTDLVSLGRNCLPWTLPNRWGLRRSEQVLTLDCPFNLAVHNFDATVEAITNNFEGYADSRYMTTVETQNGHRIAYNRRYRALWNHEKNDYWLNNEYAALRHHLQRRVDNFRNAMRSGRKLAFVMSTDEFEPEELRDRAAELHGALHAAADASDLILLCFSHDPDGEPTIREASESVYHVSRPMPSHNYIWSGEVDYSSPAGRAFEYAWTQDLRSILAKRGFA